MKILMLLFKDIHYDARVQREATALAEAGYQVTIACLVEYASPPPVLHDEITLLRMDITTKRLKRNIIAHNRTKPIHQRLLYMLIRSPLIKLLKDLLANREFYRKLKKHIRYNEQFAIHCHDLNTLPVGWLLSRKYDLKLIYDSHELFNEMVGKNHLEKKMGDYIEKKLIKKVDHLITVNPFVEAEFYKKYGDMPSTIIQNTPIFNDNVLGLEGVNYWRMKYNLDEQDILLLYQGGLTPERGIEESIDAVERLPHHYKLIILGDGRIKEKLIQRVDHKNMSDRIFFHDQVPSEDILWYTKQADIGLVMYKNTCQNNYLSTPNKIFEYMLAGIPSVASDHPGKSYIIKTEEVGVCVNENPGDIQQGIIEIMEKYNMYKNNCINKRHQYHWQLEKEKVISLYQQLGDYPSEKAFDHKPTLPA